MNYQMAAIPLIFILTIYYAPFETKHDFEGIVQNCGHFKSAFSAFRN